MNDIAEFRATCNAEIQSMGQDPGLSELTNRWIQKANSKKYSYHFTWMGLPIIQYPQDIVAMQEIVCEFRPEVIIETGVARGGSIIFYASLLELIGGPGHVVGIDIDIRPHNREAIEQHSLHKRVRLIQGSSIAPEVVAQASAIARGKRTMVVLDSNHTHDHVLEELRHYAPLVSLGGHCVVFDTVVEDLSADSFSDRPWGKGNNPKTAVHAFLKEDNHFEINLSIQHKLQITVAPDGYLRRVR
jgi:cephalosporin hydroxylase